MIPSPVGGQVESTRMTGQRTGAHRGLRLGVCGLPLPANGIFTVRVEPNPRGGRLCVGIVDRSLCVHLAHAAFPANRSLLHAAVSAGVDS
jgi:hypothetical protein